MEEERQLPELIRRLIERRESHKQRSRPYRFAFVAAGFTVTLAGLVMLVLPGPALVVIPIGLAMLALESERAERLLDHILRRLERVTDLDSTRRQKVVTTFTIGVLAAAVVGALAIWGVPLLRL